MLSLILPVDPSPEGTMRKIVSISSFRYGLNSLIVKFVLIEIVPLLAVAMFVVAGIMFYSAGGNSNRVEQAKKLFKGIVIGLVIIYGAWLIVTFVLSIIGVASWTGLQGGWYKINCPVQLPPSVSQPLNSNPSNPTTPPNPTNPTTNPANPSPPPPAP